jgi:hypothetical protein
MALTPEQKKYLAAARKLYSSPDWDSVALGLQALVSLDDPALLEIVAKGLSQNEEGLIEMAADSEVLGKVRAEHRMGVAVYGLCHSTNHHTITRLSFSGLTISLSDVQPLQRLTALQDLDLGWCKGLRDASPLSTLTSLRKLRLPISGLIDLSALAGLPQLQELTLRGASSELLDLRGLSGLTELRRLDLTSTSQDLVDLRPLKTLHKLERLRLGHHQVTDLSPLAELTQLQDLHLGTLDELSDLSPIAGLKSLQNLTIASDKLSDLRPLAGLTELRTLTIRARSVSDIGPLSGLPQLEQLDLYHCQGTLQDILPLGRLGALQALSLPACFPLADICTVALATHMKTMSLENCTELPAAVADEDDSWRQGRVSMSRVVESDD